MKSSMKKVLASVLLLMALASPAFAFGFHRHNSQHPKVNHPHRQAEPKHQTRHPQKHV
jgi:predicted S18 family serine protease